MEGGWDGRGILCRENSILGGLADEVKRSDLGSKRRNREEAGATSVPQAAPASAVLVSVEGTCSDQSSGWCPFLLPFWSSSKFIQLNFQAVPGICSPTTPSAPARAPAPAPAPCKLHYLDFALRLLLEALNLTLPLQPILHKDERDSF